MKTKQKFIVHQVWDNYFIASISELSGVFVIPFDNEKTASFKSGDIVTISVKKVKK